MALTPEDYQAQAQALAPTGKAWTTHEASTFNDLLLGIADELARIDGRANALIEEVDPRTTTELLEDWERVLGLPDACSGLASTLVGRRAAIVTKLNSTGGQTPQYYIDRAAELGFTITITEFRPFTAGSNAGGTLHGEDWVHYWQVNAPLDSLVEFHAGLSAAGEPLRDWGNDQLECLINRLKPAHTDVIFSYT